MRRTLSLALTSLTMVVLAACAQEPAEPSPPPSPSPEPTYSDEELLAQARESYEGYLAAFAEMVASDEIAYTTLSPYATDTVATADAAAETQLRDRGVRSSGAMTLTNFVPTETIEPDRVVANACLNTLTLKFVDDLGTDVSPPSRPEFFAGTLTFIRDSPSREFRLSEQNALADGAGDPCST